MGRQPDGMVNIQWRDRSTNALGFDRPVFPDDVTFKRVKTGDGKDRVYELKYKASGRFLANTGYHLEARGILFLYRSNHFIGA